MSRGKKKQSVQDPRPAEQPRPVNRTLEANLEALEKKQPLLVRRIREFMRECAVTGAKFSLNAEETPSGTWWSGFHNAPFFESNTTLEAVPEGTRPVLVLAGIGTPRYLTTLLNKIKRRQTVILLESSLKLILFALESISLFDRAAPFDLFLLLAGHGDLLDDFLHSALAQKGYLTGGFFDVCAHPGEMEICASSFKQALREYVDRINYHFMRLGNSAEDTLLGIRQMALASPWILLRENLATLKGKFKGFSGIVLSAGPSLDKNLHLIKGLEDRLVIVAADTLLDKLAVQGIRPHFVCALERGRGTYDSYFRSQSDRRLSTMKDIVLVAQSVCFPQIAGRWPGKLCVVGKDTINMDRDVIDGILGGVVLNSGVCVGNMALGILEYLGVDRVALVGQDLAFGEDGHTHTKQTAWDDTGGVEKDRERMEIPGMYGGMVQTTDSWRYIRDIFEDMIPRMKIDVFDCTEGGALIRGTKIARLADFLEGLATPPADSFALVAGELKASDGFCEERISEVTEKLTDLEGVFLASLEQMQSGRELMRGLRDMSRGTPEFMDRAREVQQLLTTLTYDNPILTYVGQSYIMLLLKDEFGLELSDDEQYETWLRSHEEFFDAHERSARIFLDWLRYMIFAVGAAPRFLQLGIASPPEEDRARNTLQGFLERSQEREPSTEEIVLADFLHSRIDPVTSGWAPHLLWMLGRHLFAEGRFLEASEHFQAAIQGFEGARVTVEAACALLKDRAKALMRRDLCWSGSPFQALENLANAYAYAPEDPELPLLLEELLRRRREDYLDVLLMEESETKREAISAVADALEKELDALRSGGEPARDVIKRYLFDILQEKREPGENDFPEPQQTKEDAPESRQNT